MKRLFAILPALIWEPSTVTTKLALPQRALPDLPSLLLALIPKERLRAPKFKKIKTCGPTPNVEKWNHGCGGGKMELSFFSFSPPLHIRRQVLLFSVSPPPRSFSPWHVSLSSSSSSSCLPHPIPSRYGAEAACRINPTRDLSKILAWYSFPWTGLSFIGKMSMSLDKQFVPTKNALANPAPPCTKKTKMRRRLRGKKDRRRRAKEHLFYFPKRKL